MTGKQWAVLIGSILGAIGGVFVGATSGLPPDATLLQAWTVLAYPQFIIGAIVAGAGALGAFWSEKPSQ